MTGGDEDATGEVGDVGWDGPAAARTCVGPDAGAAMDASKAAVLGEPGICIISSKVLLFQVSPGSTGSAIAVPPKPAPVRAAIAEAVWVAMATSFEEPPALFVASAASLATS